MMNVQRRSISHRRRILAPPAVDWWDPLEEGLDVHGAWQARGAASYADSLINLANPGTNDLTEDNGAIPWSTTLGWQFVQANQQILQTGHGVPSFNTGNSTYFCQVTDYGPGNNMCLMGAVGYWNFSIPGHTLAQRLSDAQAKYQCSCWGYTNNPPRQPDGNFVLAGKKVYYNGAYVGAVTGGHGTCYFETVLGGSRNPTTSVPILWATVNMRAAAIYHAELGATTIAAIAAAMAAL